MTSEFDKMFDLATQVRKLSLINCNLYQLSYVMSNSNYIDLLVNY